MENNNQKLVDGINILGDELRSAQFILSQNVIRKILRYIISNEELEYIVRRANENYRFVDLIATASKGNGARKFVLPTDPYKVVSLITGIFYGIDRGNIDFIMFLKSNFQGNQITSQYDEFCAYVMPAFSKAFESILNEDISTIETQTVDNVEGDVIQEFFDQMLPIMLAVSEQLMDDNTITTAERNDCIAVMEGLYYVLDKGLIPLLKGVWIGVKHTLSVSKQYSSHIRAMEGVMSDFGYL